MLNYVALFCFVLLVGIGVWYYIQYKGFPAQNSRVAGGREPQRGSELLTASTFLTPELKQYLLETDSAELTGVLAEKAGEMQQSLLEEIASLLVSEKRWEDILALTGHPDSELRERAAEVLGYLALPGGADALVPVLGDKNEGVRLAAAASLARLGDAGTAEPLAKALAHPGELVPARVAEVLLALGDKAVAPLIVAIKEAKEEGQPLIGEVLGQLGDAQAVPVLTEILQESPFDKSRAAAAKALGNLPDSGQSLSLTDALKDSYWEVRAKAAEALASLEKNEARELLQRVAETDEDWNVRVVAEAALKRLA